MHRIACLCLSGIASLCHANDWTITPGPAWTVKGEVEQPHDVSGLALAHGDDGWLVSDETRVAQRFHLDRGQHVLTAGETLRLLPEDGKEFDLEAIATSTDLHWVYMTGSHGVSRKTGKAHPDRRHVFRMGSEGPLMPEVTSLIPVIENDAMLKPCIGKDAVHDGLDIEGLAECRGHLFFGLRSPSAKGRAFVVEVSADDLFKDANRADHRTHALELGEGRGIRDLVTVNDGFLLIAGDTGTEMAAGTFTLHHWAMPSGKLTQVGTVPAAEGKAEGLLVLSESKTEFSVLVVFDSAMNGAPMELRLLRPAP